MQVPQFTRRSIVCVACTIYHRVIGTQDWHVSSSGEESAYSVKYGQFLVFRYSRISRRRSELKHNFANVEASHL